MPKFTSRLGVHLSFNYSTYQGTYIPSHKPLHSKWRSCDTTVLTFDILLSWHCVYGLSEEKMVKIEPFALEQVSPPSRMFQGFMIY